jgi:hypothetical protein
MYKIYEFLKEPCDDKSECLVADMETEESAYKRMLACFTIRNDSGKKYYSFADNAVHADIIRAKLWSNIERSKKGLVLYTVYAFDKIGETIHVYPMRVFTDYLDALDEALKFGSFCNGWIFVVDTSIYDALINYSNHNADNGRRGWNNHKVLSAEDQNIIKTEENYYYPDGTLYRTEIKKYYDSGDMDKEDIGGRKRNKKNGAFENGKQRQVKMKSKRYVIDDTERCYKCGRLFHARPEPFGNQFCSTCLANHHKEG